MQATSMNMEAWTSTSFFLKVPQFILTATCPKPYSDYQKAPRFAPEPHALRNYISIQPASRKLALVTKLHLPAHLG